MSQAGYTPIQLYYSTTAAATPSAGNLAAGELAVNITDGKLFYKDNGGVVRVLATAAGAAGDVVGPGSSTDNALVRFDGTTGKLVQNSVGVLSDAGVLTGLTGLTSSGSITFSGLTSGRVTYAGTGGLLQDSANLTFDGTTLTANALTVSNAVTLSGGTANGVAYLNGSKVLTSGSALTFDGTNLGFGGTGQRITGDFSNATLSNRVIFQTSTANGNTGLAAIPNGTGNSTGMRFFNSSDTTNSAALFVTAGTDASIQSIITGTGTYLPMTFHTGGSERMRLDTSGNVGIGTSSTSGYKVAFKNGAKSQFFSTDASNSYYYTDGNFYFGTTGADNVAAVTNNAERMRIDASGNVGIGTSSPGSKLTVLGTGSFYASTNANTGSGYGFTLTGANSKSSASDNTSLALFSNDALASNPLTLAMSLVGNATVANGYAYLQASEYGTGNWRSIALNPSGGNVGIGTNSIQGKFNVASGRSFFGANSETYSVAVGFTQSRVASGQVYYIGATDSATPAIVFSNAAGTERVRITDGGDLLVGGTSGSGRLSVFGSGTTPLTWTTILYDSGGNQMFSQRDDGAIYLGAKSASPYNLTTSNAANAHLAADGFLYRSTSSLKYKRDVQDTEHGLAEVLALRPVTYKGKSAADGDTVFGGLIAEEVHEAGLTEFVQYAEDGSPDALAYGNMVSLCIKAIQEQQAIIEQLKARLDAANL